MSNLGEELSFHELSLAFMNLATFDVLNPNLHTSFRFIKAIQGPIIFPSNINTYIRDICPSLNVIKVNLHFRPFFSQKNKTHGL
jgi:hypothetical protein